VNWVEQTVVPMAHQMAAQSAESRAERLVDTTVVQSAAAMVAWTAVRSVGKTVAHLVAQTVDQMAVL
jgi:hypothetical protein